MEDEAADRGGPVGDVGRVLAAAYGEGGRAHRVIGGVTGNDLGQAGSSARIMPASPAPPGAPIGDMGQNWLARPPMCEWDDVTPEMWLHYMPQQ